MGHARNFDEQNFNEWIVGFIGETLLIRDKRLADKSLAIRQTFALYGILHYWHDYKDVVLYNFI